MATSPPIVQYNDTNYQEHTYSRKQKSLGRLCSNFLSLYNRDGVESIGVDDAANKLGVERRRIYDIVNVLESVGVLTKKGKNQYYWKGFNAIPNTLATLREEGLRDNFSYLDRSSRTKVLNFDEDTDFNSDTGSQFEIAKPNVTKVSAPEKYDNRKEKSLGLLTQNFVKLFLCSNVDLISLDGAAKVLLGDGSSSFVMRNNAAKVRRLYDIANVLDSMRLIEKTHQPETRKPAYRWLGLRERNDSNNSTAGPPQSSESKKRTFGSDITNISFERNEVYFRPDEEAKRIKVQMKTEMVDDEFYASAAHSEHESKPSLRNYQYGPFAPVTLAKVGALEHKRVRQVRDVESIATTYRPQYHNQALRDLFDHYMEAWKSWYSEVAAKHSLTQVS